MAGIWYAAGAYGQEASSREAQAMLPLAKRDVGWFDPTRVDTSPGRRLRARGDCLVIDYCVPQTAKSAAGVPIGKNVLLKSFKARRAIEQGPMPYTEEPSQLTPGEVRETLRRMQGE